MIFFILLHYTHSKINVIIHFFSYTIIFVSILVITGVRGLKKKRACLHSKPSPFIPFEPSGQVEKFDLMEVYFFNQ